VRVRLALAVGPRDAAVSVEFERDIRRLDAKRATAEPPLA